MIRPQWLIRPQWSESSPDKPKAVQPGERPGKNTLARNRVPRLAPKGCLPETVRPARKTKGERHTVLRTPATRRNLLDVHPTRISRRRIGGEPSQLPHRLESGLPAHEPLSNEPGMPHKPFDKNLISGCALITTPLCRILRWVIPRSEIISM